MLTQFEREARIIGEEGVALLSGKHVAVFGVGGVGSYAAEALARGGIGRLTLVDGDCVSETNINRQLYALHSTLGRKKVEVAGERIRDINPDCQITETPSFFTPENGSEFDFSAYDYVVDAIDSVSCKLELIERARQAGTKIVSAMGAGNKTDPTAFRVADIYDTAVCPLAKVIRTALRKKNIPSLKVVYSEEVPAPLRENGESRPAPGSLSFVPPVVGMILAGEVIRDLLGISRKK